MGNKSSSTPSKPKPPQSYQPSSHGNNNNIIVPEKPKNNNNYNASTQSYNPRTTLSKTDMISFLNSLIPISLNDNEKWIQICQYLRPDEKNGRSIGFYSLKELRALAGITTSETDLSPQMIREFIEIFKYGTPEDTWQQQWVFNQPSGQVMDPKQARVDPVDILDRDTWGVIAKDLDSRDFGRMAQCSKAWQKLMASDIFWQIEYSKKFGRRLVHGETLSEGSWRELFHEKKSKRGIFKTSVKVGSHFFITVKLSDTELFATGQNKRLSVFNTGKILIVLLDTEFTGSHSDGLLEIATIGEWLRDADLPKN